MNADVMTTLQHLSRYLRSHPDACDTAEGIARWWVGEDAPVPLAVVETALGWLTVCGLVQSSNAADGRVRFRRAEGEDLDLQLDAMAADPQRVMPSGPRSPRNRGMH